MTSAFWDDRRGLRAEHLEVLREYATLVLLRNRPLTMKEDVDRAARLREFLPIGRSFKLTERELIVLLFRDMLGPRMSCGCPTCRRRTSG